MWVCGYLTVASSHSAAALSPPHALPELAPLGQGSAFQIIASGSLDRQGLGLHSKSSCQFNLCENRAATCAKQEAANGTYWLEWSSSFCLTSLRYVVSRRLSAATDARYSQVTQDSAGRTSTSASSGARRQSPCTRWAEGFRIAKVPVAAFVLDDCSRVTNKGKP